MCPDATNHAQRPRVTAPRLSTRVRAQPSHRDQPALAVSCHRDKRTCGLPSGFESARLSTRRERYSEPPRHANARHYAPAPARLTYRIRSTAPRRAGPSESSPPPVAPRDRDASIPDPRRPPKSRAPIASARDKSSCAECGDVRVTTQAFRVRHALRARIK